MQHDSAPAAANFISLLFIAISLDIKVPWRDFGSSAVQLLAFQCTEGAPQRSDLMLRHLGLGTAAAACHSRGQKRVSLSLPTADFRRASASP